MTPAGPARFFPLDGALSLRPSFPHLLRNSFRLTGNISMNTLVICIIACSLRQDLISFIYGTRPKRFLTAAGIFLLLFLSWANLWCRRND
jgi:hypothetical protein